MSLGKNKGITIAGLLLSIIPQLFVPGISYEGHICGVIAGFAYIAYVHAKNNNMPDNMILF